MSDEHKHLATRDTHRPAMSAMYHGVAGGYLCFFVPMSPRANQSRQAFAFEQYCSGPDT
jgi:hypothetical protein